MLWYLNAVTEASCNRSIHYTSGKEAHIVNSEVLYKFFTSFPWVTPSEDFLGKDSGVSTRPLHRAACKTEELYDSRFQKSDVWGNCHGTVKVRSTLLLNPNDSKGQWRSNPWHTRSRNWGARNILSLLLLKMEMLQCYGGGKASDLAGAKTKTRYICLQCIALTFAESLPKAAEVYAGICSVIWQAFEKSSRSYVDYEQQWME